MSKSVVDTVAIQAAAVDLNRLADTIQSSTAELRGRLGALNGAWEGPARMEFENVMQKYQRMQAQINETLGDIGRLTGRASAAYLEHENATRALFSH